MKKSVLFLLLGLLLVGAAPSYADGWPDGKGPADAPTVQPTDDSNITCTVDKNGNHCYSYHGQPKPVAPVYRANNVDRGSTGQCAPTVINITVYGASPNNCDTTCGTPTAGGGCADYGANSDGSCGTLYGYGNGCAWPVYGYGNTCGYPVYSYGNNCGYPGGPPAYGYGNNCAAPPVYSVYHYGNNCVIPPVPVYHYGNNCVMPPVQPVYRYGNNCAVPPIHTYPHANFGNRRPVAAPCGHTGRR